MIWFWKAKLRKEENMWKEYTAEEMKDLVELEWYLNVIFATCLSSWNHKWDLAEFADISRKRLWSKQINFVLGKYVTEELIIYPPSYRSNPVWLISFLEHKRICEKDIMFFFSLFFSINWNWMVTKQHEHSTQFLLLCSIDKRNI